MNIVTESNISGKPIAEKTHKRPVRLLRWFIIIGLGLTLLVGGLVGFNAFRSKMITQFFANNKPPPSAVTIAEAAHLNPLVCGLVVTIAVDAIILYPVQTAANLLAYEAGYFHTADVRRLGLGMLLLTIVVALLVLPYWSLLALPLTQR